MDHVWAQTTLCGSLASSVSSKSWPNTCRTLVKKAASAKAWSYILVYGIFKIAHVSVSLQYFILLQTMIFERPSVIEVQIRFPQLTRLTISYHVTNIPHSSPTCTSSCARLSRKRLKSIWLSTYPWRSQIWQLGLNLHRCHRVPWYPPSSGAPRCPASMLVSPRPAAPHRRCFAICSATSSLLHLFHPFSISFNFLFWRIWTISYGRCSDQVFFCSVTWWHHLL